MAEIRTGKTKKLTSVAVVSVFNKDDLTAGDGKRHDVVLGKGALATRTTVNIFELYRYCDLPIAYIAQENATTFFALDCDMIPLEVVVRKKAYGSILKRRPILNKGDEFETPIVEMYLKTSGKQWGGRPLPCDDPYLVVDGPRVHLYEPDKPLDEGLILTLPATEVLEPWMILRLEEMAAIAVRAFTILRYTFGLFDGRDYVDFKIEFGVNRYRGLVIADVVDSDSGRLLFKGEHEDKQVYREGGATEDLLIRYRRTAELTDRFKYHYEQVAENVLRKQTPYYDMAFRM